MYAPGLYARGGIGYVQLDTSGADPLARGFTAAVALGWMLLQGRDWTSGFEAAYQVDLFGGDTGTLQGVALTARLQLFLPAW